MKNFRVKIIRKLEFWIKFIWILEFQKLIFENTNEELRKWGHGFKKKKPTKRWPCMAVHVGNRVIHGLGLCTKDGHFF